MADPTDPTLINIGTHGGVGVIAAAITTAVSRFFTGKEAAETAKAQQEMSTRLALIEQRLGDIAAALAKHGDLAERVALIERDVKAVHDRLDGKRRQR